MSKKWAWVGQAGDLYFGGQDSMGIGTAMLYYLNQDSILSFELGVGTNTDFWDSIVGDTVNGNNSRVGFYYKWFATNSFYLKGGLEERNIHFNVVHYPVLGGSSNSQTADINLYSVWFGIGNQWDIKRLIIGCDWVGVSLPFANSGFSETDSGPALSPWDLKSRLTAASLDIGRFYIGLSF